MEWSDFMDVISVFERNVHEIKAILNLASSRLTVDGKLMKEFRPSFERSRNGERRGDWYKEAKRQSLLVEYLLCREKH